MWESHTAKTCTNAADQFAAEAFDGTDRTVNQNSLKGSWTGRTWTGSFKLAGGLQVYRLTFDGDKWQVARLQMAGSVKTNAL